MQEDQGYYKQVKDYYDEDSLNFKHRGETNPLLQRIRESFRKESEGIAFKNALEIGYGPGFDLVYFSLKYPESMVYGIDISEGMQKVAGEEIEANALSNCKAFVGSVEDIGRLIPDTQFDFIYVYFGSLNTVEDLHKAADILHEHLREGGKMVLTFVNKWYLAGILKPLLKLRLKTAFKRLRKTWGGYSTSRFLPSKCYSPKQVRSAFSAFRERKRRGYSIVFPAWYEQHKFQNRKQLDRRWEMDVFLNKTPLWSFGEYTLFVFEKN